MVLAIEIAVVIVLFLLGSSLYSRWRSKPKRPTKPQSPRKRTPMGRNDAGGRRNLRLVVSKRR